ncbi:MAG: NACHT domain-containing protein [Cyanobacteria bacterium P01_A01_bin.40]
MVQNNSDIQNFNSLSSTIKIFLASSSELQEERKEFEIFIYRKCKEYRKEGIFLELIIWEDFIDAMSPTRLQDEYNKAITDCDIFVSLFFTKVGKYTEEEFIKAWLTFKINNKPLIYTYIKDAHIKTSEIEKDNILSLFNFKKKLKEAGHYPTPYTNIDNLKSHFGGQLMKLVPKLKESKKQINLKETNSVDTLVQKVRSRLHDNIQSLHSTMPLWGVDRCASLGNLFVDVNILELTSSNRRSELDDLWQDFTRNNSNFRSLDRIGLGTQQQRVSGLAVLERDTNLMVVGKPGSGKTTYLQRIVTECNEGKLKGNLIPILIKLREFVDDGRKYDHNLKQFLQHYWQLDNTDIELILNHGFALVLLDGLDEVAGEAGKQITKEIKRFACSYPQIQVIVTCRTQSQESRFDRFDYVEVADFNGEQVKSFAEHWFETVCKNPEEGNTKAKEFLSQLFQEENKPILELAITPILLSLTCVVFQQTGKFYSKRSKLYEEGLELLLEQWDTSRNVVRDEIYRDLSVERKIELLSYIALKKFEQEQYVLFEQAELEGYIGKFLEIDQRESRNVLKAVESHHGLLIERAREVWSFSHLTFQEYFVARYFVRDCDSQANLKRIVIYIDKYYWRLVILMIIEILPDSSNFLELLKQGIDYSLVKDAKCQKFLDWINRKEKLINGALYQSSAFRVFYFVLHLSIYQSFQESTEPHIEQVASFFDENSDILKSLDTKLYDQFNYHLGSNLDSSKSFSIGDRINHKIKFGNNLYPLIEKLFAEIGLVGSFNSLYHIYDFKSRRGLEEHTIIILQSQLKTVELLSKALIFYFNCKPQLLDDICCLQKQKPIKDIIEISQVSEIPELVKRLKITFFEDYLIWLRKFENILLQYLNYSLYWYRLKEEEIAKLNKYFSDNEFLLSCWKNTTCPNDIIYKKITDTLLLPIAEIEKRKQSDS